MLCPHSCVQTGLLRHQRERPVAGHDHRGFDYVFSTGDTHTPDRSVMQQESLHATAGEQGHSLGDGLLRVPAVELGTKEREPGQRLIGGGTTARRRPAGVRGGLEDQGRAGALAHDRQYTLGHRPLPRGPLPEAGNQLFRRRTVSHHPAEHVLGPRVVAPFQQEDPEPLLGKRKRRARARRTRPYHDGVEGAAVATQSRRGRRRHPATP